MLTSFCGLYAHRTIRQIVLALRRPIQQIVANSCHLTLCVVVVFVSRRVFSPYTTPRHAVEVVVPTADFRPVAVSRRGQRAEVRLRRIVLILALRQGLIPDLDRRLTIPARPARNCTPRRSRRSRPYCDGFRPDSHAARRRYIRCGLADFLLWRVKQLVWSCACLTSPLPYGRIIWEG